jgi:hypothetical protein
MDIESVTFPPPPARASHIEPQSTEISINYSLAGNFFSAADSVID